MGSQKFTVRDLSGPNYLRNSHYIKDLEENAENYLVVDLTLKISPSIGF